MQHVIEQLESVRRLGRLMLITRRILQVLITLCIAALLCGVADFLFRFPGWLRLVIGVAFLAFLSLWLFARLGRAFGFAPDLATLALRAERLFPHLRGVLASGVEFTTHPDDYADPQRTAQFAKNSVSQVESRLAGESLQKLINPAPTLRVGAMALIALLVITVVVIAAPASSAIAAQRWLMPLGQTEWPRRTHITSLVGEQVQPADAPLRLSARVDKGYSEGMRAWVYYQVQGKDGEYRAWQSALMSEQTPGAGASTSVDSGDPASTSGLFERLIDLSPDFTDFVGTGASSQDGLPADGVLVNFYFKAGDDWTQPQTVRVVPRPAVKAVTVTLTPPEYAKGLVNEETVSLDKQSGRAAAVSGLEGSTVKLLVDVNKPFTIAAASEGVVAGLVPGLAGVNARFEGGMVPATATGQRHQFSNRFALTFTLTKSIETPIKLIDEHGLDNLSDRVYRIDVRADVPPTVAMIEPPADEAVLATAVIKLEGNARDDVAVESLKLEASLPPLAPPRAGEPPKPELKTLEETAGRSDRLVATHTLDLAKLGLKPGDAVTLTAIAQDVFNLDGKRHDPVRSTPRTLRIVDAAALINQIRNELGGLRQQAMRMDARQQELKQSDPATAQPNQEQLTQTLTRQQEAIEGLNQRMQRNKLDDPQIGEMINRAKDLLNKAGAESQEAAKKLDQAKREEKDSAAQKDKKAEAGKHQDNVSQALKDIVGLLDEGKSALALQAQLRQIDQAQKSLAEQTRDLLPKTAGRNANELDPKDRKELERIAEQQKNLAKQADELVKQMKAAAEALDKQGDKPQDKAQAQALNEAANIAQREGLKEKMEQAAKDAEENKLSQAGNQQEEASQTLEQMMSQMQGQDKKQQEMLRRMLAKLEESIAKLIDQQKAQLARLAEAKELPQVADALSALRRNTMAVAEEARPSAKTAAAAVLLDAAAQSQGDAITFLRGTQREPATTAETDALKDLEEALKLVREQAKKEAQAENQQKRDELKGEYEKLAKAQDALLDRTKLIAAEKELTRRQRAEVTQIAQAEAELQAEANKLKEKVGETLIFQHLHITIDEAATNAITRLRAIEASQAVLDEQQTISQALRMMAKALDEAKEDDNPFENPQASQPQGDQQGEGAQAKPKLVPDLAELRLLRGLQESLYRKTRSLDENPVGDSERVKRLEGLSSQQLRLRLLGEAMIRKMTQGPGPQGPPPEPVPSPIPEP